MPVLQKLYKKAKICNVKIIFSEFAIIEAFAVCKVLSLKGFHKIAYQGI